MTPKRLYCTSEFFCEIEIIFENTVAQRVQMSFNPFRGKIGVNNFITLSLLSIVLRKEFALHRAMGNARPHQAAFSMAPGLQIIVARGKILTTF